MQKKLYKIWGESNETTELLLTRALELGYSQPAGHLRHGKGRKGLYLYDDGHVAVSTVHRVFRKEPGQDITMNDFFHASAKETYGYAAPEKMVMVKGKEYSEDTLQKAMRQYVA